MPTNPTDEAAAMVERLETRAEQQKTARGDYLYRGHADPELSEAVTLIAKQAREIARLREALLKVRDGVRDDENGWLSVAGGPFPEIANAALEGKP